MSIKVKLSFFISLIVAVILALNMLFSYITATLSQRAELRRQMDAVVTQISAAIETMEETRATLDSELGAKLRLAAIAIQKQLPSDIASIRNDRLAVLSRELELHDITLWQREKGKIVSVRSSNPKEIGLRSENWDYWDTAFHQLFDLFPVTVDIGERREHFWSGPINFAASNPYEINKWGYYYDGSANYMVNPIINMESHPQFDPINSTDAIINHLLLQQPQLLEVTGFNPEHFGAAPMIRIKQGVPVYNLDIRDISFGTYQYPNAEDDEIHIQTALRTGEAVSASYETEGMRVLRHFIPIQASKPYVIGIAFNEKLLHEPLQRQMLAHGLISLLLVVASTIASYFIAGYMLQSLNQIMNKVNAISRGNFNASISIRNTDELGQLAARVNTMGNNLLRYTEQLKETAAELQKTKQYLESFVNHTSDAIHVVDLDGNIVQVNDAFESIYGWRRDEVIGKPLPCAQEEHRTEDEALWQLVHAGGSVTDVETVRTTKTGRTIDIRMTISSIRDEHERIVAIASISRDITARKQQEEAVRRSEKLSLIGQLAAVMAHEVRNPLTTLQGFMQLYRRTGALSPDHVELVMSELDQINSIASEFLVLSKPQAERKEWLNVRQCVNRTVAWMESEAASNGITLNIREITAVPPLWGVETQLKQAIGHLIKNGMEAMADGGQLSIELERRQEGGIAVRFIDQGNGMTEDEMSRAGEPFYSNKTSGGGLGLLICQQIARNHNGTIGFISKIGHGTTVELLFPARHGDRKGYNDDNSERSDPI